MKKFLLIATMIFFFCGMTVAQTATPMLSATFGINKDTVTSTTAHYLISTPVSSNKTVAIVIKGLEISGVTSGTATLECSNDGILWHSYYDSHGTSVTFTFTDTTVVQVFGWDITEFAGKYLRVKVVGIGTPNFQISATYVVKT